MFQRQNFRRRIPVAAGLVIVLAVLVGALPYSLVGCGRATGRPSAARSARPLLAAVGFGLFGLLDDLAGTTGAPGFRRHLGALRDGELTTGLVKLVGGALVAVVVAWPWATRILGRLVGATLVVALAANLANLLDRAPGRIIKVSLLAFAVLAVTSHHAPELAGPALVAGAGVGMPWPDLRERGMLGDTGSNVLGAGAGLGLVATPARGRGGGGRGARRAQPGQRVGQLQRRDRPHTAAALVRPPRRPAPLRVSEGLRALAASGRHRCRSRLVARSVLARRLHRRPGAVAVGCDPVVRSSDGRPSLA